MKDLTFETRLRWSDTGRGGGIGRIKTDQVAIEISGPGSMGGLGVGTNPEELLVSAVASCYIATLFGVLRHAKLPVQSLALGATGLVTGFPGRAQFARLTVSPTIFGGDRKRREEYEAAATRAHDRCLIGRALSPDVFYDVGEVRVRGHAAPVASDSSSSEAARERPLAWRAA